MYQLFEISISDIAIWDITAGRSLLFRNVLATDRGSILLNKGRVI